MSNTLYEITGQYMELLEMLEDEEADTTAIMDTLEGIDCELEEKAEGYAKIIKELEGEAKKYSVEKERLAARETTLLNRAKLLKDNLYNSMNVTGKTKFKTELFSFGIQKNGGVLPLNLLEGEVIPQEFLKFEPDNEKIRQALNDGQQLSFASFGECGTHLRIR